MINCLGVTGRVLEELRAEGEMVRVKDRVRDRDRDRAERVHTRVSKPQHC